jgi:small subunit ribosomal protein S20
VANHKSALKRAGQNERRRLRNKSRSDPGKKRRQGCAPGSGSGDMEDAVEQLNTAKSAIDNAAKKGVLHKKTASRKVSRLAKQVNARRA